MPSLRDTVAQFCHRHHLRLNTDLGQHFLVDQEILDKIVQAGDVQKTDHVVEIGPGVGVLTKELLARAGHVTAIELDQRMIPLLNDYVGNLQKNLTVINENALQTSMPTEPYTIVANIPYHITSPLLRHVFLESTMHPSSLTLLIQREVAEKICDKEHAGLLTIIVGMFGEPHIVTRVPPESFLPPPAVDSAVLHIRCFPQPLAERATFDRVLSLAKAAFGQKRKMLSNSIGSLPDGDALLQKAGIDPTLRPEKLTLAQWIALAKVIDA